MSLEFNGTTSYAQRLDDPTLETANYSYAFWLKVASLPSAQLTPLGKYSNPGSMKSWAFTLDETGAMLFVSWINGGLAVLTLSGITTNTWFQIVATYNGTTVRFYKNAVQQSTDPRSGNPDDTDAPIRLGCMGDTTPEDPIACQIEDFSIYNRALSPVEITLLKNSPGQNIVPAGRIMWWKLNQTPIGGAASGANSIIDSQVGAALPGTPFSGPIWRLGQVPPDSSPKETKRAFIM